MDREGGSEWLFVPNLGSPWTVAQKASAKSADQRDTVAGARFGMKCAFGPGGRRKATAGKTQLVSGRSGAAMEQTEVSDGLCSGLRKHARRGSNGYRSRQ